MFRRRPLLLALVLAACAHPAASTRGIAVPDACAGPPLVALDELSRGGHAGQRIAVEAQPRADVACTLIGCGKENPCCNRCSGGYQVDVGGGTMMPLTGLAGCTGNQCDVKCEPLGRSPSEPYRFVGQYQAGSEGTPPSFQVEKVCRAGGSK